ncbi:MAG TPA: ABC transporter ATP-binding protein [Actinospica sp.]|nr:ABC transporter ATP-binding protein [Actinospica sp.]
MAETDTPAVLRGVTKRFRATTAVEALDWAPKRGMITALVGLNGAGKSTAMRVMTGLVKPTEGTVAVVAGPGGRTLSAMIEAPGLYSGLSVRRNLEIHRVLTNAPTAQVGEIAELLQIGEVMGRRVGALSQGFRQRVAIGVALLGSPAVLLLDEPTNALDPDAILQLRHLIRQIADRNTAVVVSTHQLRELEGTADALTLIHEGRIRYDGPFADFVGSPDLRVRAADDAATDTLARLMRAEGVRVERIADSLRLAVDGPAQVADLLAALVFDVAAGHGLKLVELGHRAPTLEEAFRLATSGEH